MSYDRRRLRGYHPKACTCAECQERKNWRVPTQRIPIWRKNPEPNTPPERQPRTNPPNTLPERRPQTAPPDAKRNPERNKEASYADTRKPNFPSRLVTPEEYRREQEERRRKSANTTNIHHSRKPLRIGAFKIWLGVVVAVLLFFGLVWAWMSSNPEEYASGQVAAEEGGSWFDCDSERRRKRGGWLKSLVC